MLLTGRGSGDLTSFRKGPDRVPAGGGLAHHELPEVCAFVQNLRRGHYDIATDVPDHHRLRKAFDDLAITI